MALARFNEAAFVEALGADAREVEAGSARIESSGGPNGLARVSWTTIVWPDEDLLRAALEAAYIGPLRAALEED